MNNLDIDKIPLVKISTLQEKKIVIDYFIKKGFSLNYPELYEKVEYCFVGIRNSYKNDYSISAWYSRNKESIDFKDFIKNKRIKIPKFKVSKWKRVWKNEN